MRRSISLVALCALALTALSASAGAVLHSLHHPDVVSTERGIETSSDLVLLPSSEIGNITVNYCAQCKSVTYAVTHDTQYFVGTERITLADLHRYVVPGESRFMMVYVSLTQPVVQRVVVVGTPGGSQKRH